MPLKLLLPPKNHSLYCASVNMTMTTAVVTFLCFTSISAAVAIQFGSRTTFPRECNPPLSSLYGLNGYGIAMCVLLLSNAECPRNALTEKSKPINTG